MILPSEKTKHDWRVASPDGAYILETRFEFERECNIVGFDLRLLENSEVLLTLPMVQWTEPVDFTNGRFTFTFAHNGRRAAIRLDPAQRTFVFQPTDAPEPFSVLADRLAKMFGRPLPVGSIPRVDLNPTPPVDWTQSPPRGAIILNAVLGLFNFTMGAVLIYLPSRLGFIPPSAVIHLDQPLQPAGTGHHPAPLPILIAAAVFCAGLLAQLFALPRLFPQLTPRPAP